jgi:hypothetical protein
LFKVNFDFDTVIAPGEERVFLLACQCFIINKYINTSNYVVEPGNQHRYITLYYIIKRGKDISVRGRGGP